MENPIEHNVKSLPLSQLRRGDHPELYRNFLVNIQNHDVNFCLEYSSKWFKYSESQIVEQFHLMFPKLLISVKQHFDIDYNFPIYVFRFNFVEFNPLHRALTKTNSYAKV